MGYRFIIFSKIQPEVQATLKHKRAYQHPLCGMNGKYTKVAIHWSKETTGEARWPTAWMWNRRLSNLPCMIMDYKVYNAFILTKNLQEI